MGASTILVAIVFSETRIIMVRMSMMLFDLGGDECDQLKALSGTAGQGREACP